MPSKKSIHILDCTLRDEPSEGTVLEEFFRIPELRKKVSIDMVRVKTKQEFLKQLGRKCDILHISAHGYVRKLKRSDKTPYYESNSQRIALPFGEVGSKDLEGKITYKPEFIFLNACSMNWKEMYNAFHPDATFLAPYYDVYWDEAIVYALRFYQRLFIKREDYVTAFHKTGKELKLKGIYNRIYPLSG